MTPYNWVTAARSEAPRERRDKFSDRKRVSRAQVSASELFILCHSGVLESAFTVNHPKLRFAPLRSRSSLLGRLCQALPPAREDSTCGPRGSGRRVRRRRLLRAEDSTRVLHGWACGVSAEPLKGFPS